MKKFRQITAIIFCLILSLPAYLYAETAKDVADKIANKKINRYNKMETKLNQARELSEQKKYQEAVNICQEVLNESPDNSEAKELLESSRNKQKAYMISKMIVRKKKNMRKVLDTLDDEFIELFKRPDERNEELEEKLKGMVLEAKRLWSQGKYEQALAVCEKMKEDSPSDIRARVKINEIVEDIRKYAERESELVTRKRILAVKKSWLPPKPSISNGIDEDEVFDDDKIISSDKQRLLAKSGRIIPEINFTNAHLRDVIQYLSKIGGVNIILDESVLTETSEGEDADDRITISLKNIPLIEALKYILITKGMEFRIEDHAIWIAKNVDDIEMVTRTYSLPRGTGVERILSYEGETKQDEVSGSSTIETGGDITQLLREAVPFPPSSKVFLDPRTSTLLITNTVANHTLIEGVLKNLSRATIQVQIEAKFVRISETDEDELGLELFLNGNNWNTNTNTHTSGVNPPDTYYNSINTNTADAAYGQFHAGGTEGLTHGLRFSGSASSLLRFSRYSGVLSEPQFSAILHAISQNQVTDVISAPKITTINGQQAIIKDVTEYIYPLEFSVTQATFNDDGDAVTPSVVTVGDFQTRKVGIVLSVTPDVGADHKTITITVMPEISDIESWINYGTTDVPIMVPHFETETVVTTVIINDGETVVMGGLVEESVTSYDDKIPFLGDIPYLGRMFRTKRETSVKTNLLIFLTAKIITPNGSEYREVLVKRSKEKE